MTTKVTPLGIRLFLEGMEVPVISAQVNVVPDQPATAAIQIVPSDMAMHLLPRTLVHLFYLDDEQLPYPPSNPRVQQDGGQDQAENNTNRFDAPDEQYKLMFCGEVIGYNYSKTPSSRQLVLQCMDLSSYWNTCYQWFADYSVGGNGLTDRSHSFLGAGASMFNSVAGGHQWVIGRILNTKPNHPEYQDAKGLLSGVIHLLEAIGGIRYRGKKKDEIGFNGVNDFFTIAELRYNLLGMIGAVSADDTSAKMYANKAFRQWLKNGMTSLGSLLSFRDILNHVNRHIFHHIFPNPAPYFAEGSIKERSMLVDPVLYTDTPSGQNVKLNIKYIGQAVNKAWDGFKLGEVGSVSNFVTGVRSLTQAKEWLEKATEGIGSIESDDKTDIESALKGVKAIFDDSDTTIAETGYEEETDPVTGAELEGWNEETETLTPENITNQSEQLSSFMEEAARIIEEDILSKKARAKVLKPRKVRTTEGAHLYSQLLFPETYFVSPPKCNILFPDQYFQFSFSRNFMREVSRLSCQGGLGMLAGGRRGAALFASHYYAPNITDARGKNLYATWSKGASVLLPHEIHSGIIPKFEWVPDGHRWGAKASYTGNTSDKFYYNQFKINYIQRLANFQFYLHRWSARTMSISGVFNPRIVLGLPALVMDRSMPAPEVVKQIEAKLERKWLPMQFLGKVAQYSHNIHQAGGQTQVTYTHCRTHRGLDDDFLQVLNREVAITKAKKFKRSFKVTNLLSSNSISDEDYRNRAAEAGRGSGALLGSEVGNKLIIKDRESFKKLVAAYIEGKLVEGQKVPGSVKAFRGTKIHKIEKSNLTEFSKADALDLGVNTNDTVTLTRDSWQPVEGAEPGEGITNISSSGEEVVYNLVEVKEQADILKIENNWTVTFEVQVPTGEYKRADRSVEEALTPGWYSKVWVNFEKDGSGKRKPGTGVGAKVYGPLLGVEALTDGTIIGSKEQDELLTRNIQQEANQAVFEVSEGEFGEQTFDYSTESNVPGCLSQMEILPGSIEEAVDALTVVYGLIRANGGDVHEFIRNYTHRPIADMKDVLGSQNLAYDDSGNIDPNLGEDVVEGYHSRAFGDYNVDPVLPDREGAKTAAGKDALKALFPGVATGTPVERPNAMDRGNPPSSIEPHYDPRGRARARVRGYIQELSISRGLLG